jgi:hypothetical protein
MYKGGREQVKKMEVLIMWIWCLLRGMIKIHLECLSDKRTDIRTSQTPYYLNL